MTYQSLITNFNQPKAVISIPIDMEFVHIYKAIQQTNSKKECHICFEDCKLSEAFYSVSETLSSDEPPYHGYYHEDCFMTWFKNRETNNYPLIDPVSNRKLVLKFKFPILISVQKSLDDFTNLNQQFPLKQGYQLKLIGQKMSTLAIETSEDKLLPINKRPNIYQRRKTAETTNPSVASSCEI